MIGHLCFRGMLMISVGLVKQHLRSFSSGLLFSHFNTKPVLLHMVDTFQIQDFVFCFWVCKPVYFSSLSKSFCPLVQQPTPPHWSCPHTCWDYSFPLDKGGKKSWTIAVQVLIFSGKYLVTHLTSCKLDFIRLITICLARQFFTCFIFQLSLFHQFFSKKKIVRK